MMRLSRKQAEYLSEANRRWNIKTGATRSGKTYVDIMRVIPRRVIDARGDGLIVLIGNTIATVERNILAPMRARYTERLVSTVRTADGSVKLFGKKAYVLGADAKSRVAALQGAGIEYCYGDEMTTWAEEVFWMLKSRLDLETSVFDGTCNPEGPNHWMKKFLDSGADIFQQRYTIDDNPFLPPEFVRKLKQEYAGTVYYDRYILGRWARAEGLVYPMFQPDRHIVKHAPKIRRIYFSTDVGHSNATAFLSVGLGVDGRAYVLSEYYHSGREAGAAMSPLAYAKAFCDFQHREIEKVGDGAVYEGVCIDPSALGFIAQLRELSVLRTYRAANAVGAGIQTVASLIDADRLRVLSDCKRTIGELAGYTWDASASDRGLDVPRKEDDHAMDALRYVLHTRRNDFQRARREELWT